MISAAQALKNSLDTDRVKAVNDSPKYLNAISNKIEKASKDVTALNTRWINLRGELPSHPLTRQVVLEELKAQGFIYKKVEADSRDPMDCGSETLSW